jgi:hypothetical protein
MRITIEPTDTIVTLVAGVGDTGVEARIWSGVTDSGDKVHVFVTRVAVPLDVDQSRFAEALQECRKPEAIGSETWPTRLLL